ncbi:FkbM family methyltransferase [Burkholderia multivorans]|uniref:FkbM family methyltransferase n=1 Tax=Burkholderia multivorans TaxID=87883 RepID=UPI0009C11F25|nr:FkbM family methyltransferase [Burkholderia multivorans]MDN8100037.1 FkbM family methyltransferase [Burkholderia multivorans]
MTPPSGLFHSYQKSPDLISKYNALDYDPDSIEHCLRHLRADEIFFNNLFVEKGISPVNIFYEDLVEDPESVLAEMKQVIAGQSVRQAIARSGTLEKLADEKSAEWERRFRLERSGIIQNIELDRLVDMRSHQIEQVITLSTTDTNVVTPASESMPIGRTETPFGTMVYLPNDDPIGESLARYGEWAKAEIELVSHFIPMGSTVIDVGANIGTHSLAFAQYTGRTGRVIAIEPQPAVFDILARNVAENGLSQIDLIQSGASSSSGEMFFSRLNYSGHINSGAIALDSTSGETRVDVITLDSLQLECCAFVKVDAEGMEFDVLKGAVDLIRRSAPTLLMEVNTVDRAIELNRFVSELGYSVFFARTKAFNSDNFKRETDNFFGVATETSLLCIHKSKGWPRIPESSLFDVYPIESADRLAALFISSPRFGDLTEHDRDADWLRDELKHEKASHHEAMSKLESALYRSTLLDRQVDALDAEIKVLKQQVQQYMERSAKLLVAENQIATLQSELNREKEFGQMILRSSSWRLTRPLRVARRFLKI